MRYFISFLFSLTLFLNPVLKAASNNVDNTNSTEGKIFTDTKEQAGLSEDSSYLFNSINNQVQVSEFTPRNLYELNIYPPECENFYWNFFHFPSRLISIIYIII